MPDPVPPPIPPQPPLVALEPVSITSLMLGLHNGMLSHLLSQSLVRYEILVCTDRIECCPTLGCAVQISILRVEVQNRDLFVLAEYHSDAPTAAGGFHVHAVLHQTTHDSIESAAEGAWAIRLFDGFKERLEGHLQAQRKFVTGARRAPLSALVN